MADDKLLAPPRHPKLRRVGVHGARNSGKTCFFATLYGSQNEDDIAVTFSDEPTMDYLRPNWDLLRAGQKPGATALTFPSELNFALVENGRSWDVSTRDFAGALVQRTPTELPEIKQEVKEWLAGCDALLLFLNIDDALDPTGTELLNRQEEIGLLVKALRSASGGDDKVRKPIAILLTKWDRQGPVSSDAHREQIRARTFLSQHTRLGQLAATLEKLGDRVELFPVSAFGSHREGDLPPPGGPRPIGIHPALAWVARKTDEVAIETARAAAKQLEDKSRLFWFKDFRGAEQLLEKTRDDWGVRSGPLWDVTENDLRTYRAHRAKQTWSLRGATAAAVTICVSLVAALAAWLHDESGYQVALAALQDETTPPAELYQRVEQYRRSLNPATILRGRVGDIETRYQQTIEVRRNAALSRLERFREENPGDVDAHQRAAECARFLADWPRSPSHGVVERWLGDDRQAEKIFNDIQRVTAFKPVLDGAPLSETDHDAEARKLLAEVSRGPAANRREVGELREAVLRRAEERARRLAADFAALLEYRAANSTLPLAGARVAKDQSFLATWKSSAHTGEVARWLASDLAEEKRHQRAVEFEQPHADLRTKLESWGRQQKYAEQMNAIAEFLSRFSADVYVDQRATLAALRAEQTAANRNRRELLWTQAQEYAAANPRAFDGVLQRCDAYLKETGCENASAARALVAHTESLWDADKYQKLLDAGLAAAQRMDESSLTAARSRAAEYLEPKPSRKRMRSHAEDWLRWHNGLVAGRDCQIMVRRLAIPPNSELVDTFGGSQPRVVVTLNGRTRRTSWGAQRVVDFNQSLGKFPARFGPAQLSVTVEEQDNFNATATARAVFISGFFAHNLLNSPLAVVDARGEKIIVTLECADLAPPHLPPYPTDAGAAP